MHLTPQDIQYIQAFQAFTQETLAAVRRAGKCHNFTEGFFIRLLDLLDKFKTEFWNVPA